MSTAPRASSRPLDSGGAQRRHGIPWLSDEQAALTFQLHGERLRLDFDDPVTPPHVEWSVGLDASLSADLARNDEPPGTVHGSNHGRDFTMSTIGVLAVVFRDGSISISIAPT